MEKRTHVSLEISISDKQLIILNYELQKNISVVLVVYLTQHHRKNKNWIALSQYVQ